MVIHGRIARAVFVTLLLSAPSVFAQKKSAERTEPEYIPGQFLVRMSNPAMMKSQWGLQNIEEAVRGKVLKVFNEQNFMLVQKPLVQSMGSQMRDLETAAGVVLVEPNYIYRANKVPNDPDLEKLWGLTNFGQNDSEKQTGLNGMDIGAEKAWDITTGSKKVIVAVIDTGVDYNHPDLKDNAWVNQAELNGLPGVDDDGNGIVDDIHGASFANPSSPSGNPMDDHGHGTHCSGTIGAKGDDGKGIVGVAWDVQIMGVKFLGADGSGSLDGAILAIDYATKMGAHIQSNSWGGGGRSTLLEEAVKRSRDAGLLFVAAASNNGENNDTTPAYPATYPVENIVSVAAIDNRGQLADFSNFGKTTVHLAAPGVNVYSSLQGGRYDSWSGTSMATPHVSGVAALLLASNPQMTALEMKERLMAGARPLAGLKNKTISGGVVNAFYSLTGETPPEDPNDPSKWASKSIRVESEHPYQKKTYQEFEVSVPGAVQIAVYFSKFQTERGYDHVRFYDKNNNLIGSMTGAMDDSFSPIIPGDYVKMVLQSDDSIEKYGFEADAVYFR